MAKHEIGVCRMAVGGNHRAEIGNWLVEIAALSSKPSAFADRINDVKHFSVSRVPTDCARNWAVDVAQKHKLDILFMCDDDSAPPEGWFEAAATFLMNHKGPALIGCPYVSGGAGSVEQLVQVFTWQSPMNSDPACPQLKQIPREDAARRKGIEEVANIGTHCIAYRMDCFDQIDRPYYEYSYDERHLRVIDTEEVRCHRRMWLAKVPVYVHWDYWADHYKLGRLEKPWVISREDVEATFNTNIKALVGQPQEAPAAPAPPIHRPRHPKRGGKALPIRLQPGRNGVRQGHPPLPELRDNGQSAASPASRPADLEPLAV